MKAIVKETNESIEVVKKPVKLDPMTVYMMFQDVNTGKWYNYKELKFD